MASHNLPLSLALPATLRVVHEEAATVAILCIFSSFFFIWLLHKGRISGTLPPGPPAWPIIGNLHQMRLPAHRFLKSLADKYGPIFFLRLGSVPAVVVSSSEIAKQFLKTHDLIFASRPLTAAGRLMFFNSQDVAFSPYGDHWKKMRKICVSQLLTAERIESFRGVREEEVSAVIHSIWEESERGTMSVNVSKAITTVNSNIIWRILTGRKFSDDDLGGDFKGFKDLLVEMTAAMGEFNIGDFIPYLDCLDLQGINRRLKKLHRTFDGFAEKMIDGHVKHFLASSSNGQKEADAEPNGHDFVDVLLRMAGTDGNITRETMKALVLDMFTAGQVPTSTTLEWAMSELLRHPHAMKRLQEEIESVVGQYGKVKESDLASMKFLHCVVKETLRLHPPGPLAIPHESVEAVTVGGYYIPKKTTLMVNLWGIGRDPNVWGKYASKFKPERFMENENFSLTDPSDISMIPFGAGRRGCPGISMAVTIIELVLAQLFHTFDWRVEGGPSQLDMTETCGLTVARQVPLCAYPTFSATRQGTDSPYLR